MKKLTLDDLEHREDWEYAVVVFKSESFSNYYSLKERSYVICRDNKWFKPYALGCSLFGNCLDGKDMGVRLDWYMRDTEHPWIIDYCYIISEEELKELRK